MLKSPSLHESTRIKAEFPRISACRGQTLLIVIAVLAILFVVTLSFFVLSQVQRTSAIRNLDSLRARYLAEAGIVYAQQLLKFDKQTNPIDTLQDLTFTHFQGEDVDLDGDGKSESKWFNMLDNQGNPFGRFSVKVSDEASRLNINSSSSETLGRLFSALGLSASKLNSILSGRPFNAKEELGQILGTKDFAATKDFLTIYSHDLEIDLYNRRRAYLNSSQIRVNLEAFLNAGIKDAYRKAANLKDASDVDFAQTILDKFSQDFSPTNLLESGAWRKLEDFYEAQPGEESPGEFIWFNLPLEDGWYYCFLYGPESTDVVGGDPPMFSGEGLKDMVEVKGGSLTLSIEPAKDKTSRFSHIELTSINSKDGLSRKIITGTEALVINELMVKPGKEILTDSPAYIDPGQSQLWTFTQQRPGDYYVVVEALTQGGLVGDVYINGKLGENLGDQDYFPNTVNVGNDGNIVLEVKNNSLQKTSFKGIKILQEPDSEFIELVNLSPEKIDLDDFSLEVYTDTGEIVAGWPARIPVNTKIEPYQHLVLAVDSNDTLSTPWNLQKNKISFKGIYKINAVGLLFDEATTTINKNSDLIPDSGGRIILKDAFAERIDAVEYKVEQVQDFVSLERASPSAKFDSNANGFFDGWYVSESKDLATPAAANENSGMYVSSESGTIKKDISELSVFNRPLSGLEEAQQLSSGENWEKFSVEDIARMADHFAYEAISFDMTSHKKSQESDNIGTWEFPQIPEGSYLLSILSDDVNLESKEIQVGIKLNGAEALRDYLSLLFAQGIAFYGTVALPKTPSTLQLEIVADTKEIISGLKGIQLEPVYATAGRLNINTAKPEILRSLLSSDSLVEVILKNRPIGAKDNSRLGVGELFLLAPGFIPFYNELSVKSDVYEINSRGEFIPQGKTLAYQTIRTVIERAQ